MFFFDFLFFFLNRQIKNTESNERLAFFGLCLWVTELNARGVPSENAILRGHTVSARLARFPRHRRSLALLPTDILGTVPAFTISNLVIEFAVEGYLTCLRGLSYKTNHH